MIGLGAGHLLRRHVTHGAEHGARVGVPRHRGCVGFVLTGCLRFVPGELEVENLHTTVGGDEDVRRLEVAVNDRHLVCGSEPICDGGPDLGRLPPTQGRAVEPILEGLSVEDFDDDEWAAVMLAQLVDVEDVGVGELCDGLGFPLESSQPV